MHNYITKETATIPRLMQVCFPQSHTDMYEDIRKKAWIFILIIGWWQKIQAESHSESVIRALTGTTGQPELSVTSLKYEETVTKQDI